MPSDCRGFRSRLTVAGAAAAVLVALTGSAALAHNAGWKSGVRRTGVSEPTAFATWRATPLGVVVSWIQWRSGGWSEMYQYASGYDVRALRRNHPNVSLGQPLFPTGGSLGACASGEYNDEHREVASRLAANGVGDAEIRLGWEANGDWYPWQAAGVDPTTWKRCFVNAAKTFKSVSQNFRIAWSMNKKGRIAVRTIYPDSDAGLITNICVSHYDDPWDRFGNETFMGGPYGLRAWAAFAREKGKKLCLGEWGVGRDGDNPQYIQDMHDFLEEAGDGIAHEAYFNTGKWRLYPVGPNPRSSALYRELF